MFLNLMVDGPVARPIKWVIKNGMKVYLNLQMESKCLGTRHTTNHQGLLQTILLVFPEPYTFNPQRWIDDACRVYGDLRFLTFGFGRRVSWSTCRKLAFCLSENPAAKIDALAF
ncbi:hypothetical protein C8R48DRAFT_764819 [Suillus tomentosus]|nr:hypothetical protein C8R48DRAFT_764819 [Suillus tomentosus]